MRFNRTLGRLNVGHTNESKKCERLTALAVRFLTCDDPVRRPFNA